MLFHEMLPDALCIYKSTNLKKLIKEVKKIEEFFGRPVRLIDERPERDPKIVKSENIISVCVIVGFSLVFIGGFGLLVCFDKVLLILVILGIVIIILGLIYGKFNIPFSHKE